MKKFLLKVFLPTIIIVLTLFVGLEIYIRSLPNDFKEKNQYLESNAKTIKIMVLGDSGASFGIMPRFFDFQPSYNFAYHAQSIKYNQWILNKCFDRMDSLKYVILNVSMGTLWGFDHNIAAQSREKFYTLYYGYPLGEKNAFEVSSSPIELFHRINPSSKRESLQTIDSDGYQSDYYDECLFDYEKWLKSAKRDAETWNEASQNYNNYNKNVNVLHKIIKKCKEKNVPLILLTTPALRMYYDNLNPALVSDFYSQIDSLKNEYENVLFLDYFQVDSLFSADEDFYNSSHLNPDGAKKFSVLLNDTIMKIESYRNGETEK